MKYFYDTLIDHDRAMLINENGLMLYQLSSAIDEGPISVDQNGLQYWTPREAIMFAEHILAHREYLEDCQRLLEGLLEPLADFLLVELGERVEHLHDDWAMLRREAFYLLQYNQDTPLAQAFRERSLKDEFSHGQLEALLEHVLHGKLRQKYPLKMLVSEAEQKLSPLVSAACYSDDRVYDISFDATPWFAQASDEELQALQVNGYGGNYSAVAEYMAWENAELQAVFRYNHSVPNPKTFECTVNKEQAQIWIWEHRPHLAMV